MRPTRPSRKLSSSSPRLPTQRIAVSLHLTELAVRRKDASKAKVYLQATRTCLERSPAMSRRTRRRSTTRGSKSAVHSEAAKRQELMDPPTTGISTFPDGMELAGGSRRRGEPDREGGPRLKSRFGAEGGSDDRPG